MIQKIFLYTVFTLFLVTALAIPVAFQSMTLWYKYGGDRILLQGAQFVGIVAFVFLYLQVVLSTRGKLLERVFGVAALMKWHRWNGVLVLFLAIFHILLVLLPEGLANLPIGLQFWPELIGLLLFLVLFVIVVSSRYRELLRLQYRSWRFFHKPMGYLAIFLVSSHVLFVSDSFEHILPRIFLFVSFGALILWVCYVKWSSFVGNEL